MNTWTRVRIIRAPLSPAWPRFFGVDCNFHSLQKNLLGLDRREGNISELNMYLFEKWILLREVHYIEFNIRQLAFATGRSANSEVKPLNVAGWVRIITDYDVIYIGLSLPHQFKITTLEIAVKL